MGNCKIPTANLIFYMHRLDSDKHIYFLIEFLVNNAGAPGS